MLSLDQQINLLAEFDDNEIKAALWSIPPEKSPGPDGYGSGFYRVAWPIIGSDVIKTIREFFRTGHML